MANGDFMCVLRASCRRPGLGALLRAYPRWKPDGAWKAGVPNAVGRVPKTNGFNLFVGEGGDWKEVAALIRRRMRSLRPMIREGRKIRAEFELDIGIFLGRSEYLTRSTLFSPKDLAPFVDLGVDLRVSAYPPSAPDAGRRRRPSERRRQRGGSFARPKAGSAGTRQIAGGPSGLGPPPGYSPRILGRAGPPPR